MRINIEKNRKSEVKMDYEKIKDFLGIKEYLGLMDYEDEYANVIKWALLENA